MFNVTRKINVHRAHSRGLIWFSVTFGFMSRFIGVWQLLLLLCVCLMRAKYVDVTFGLLFFVCVCVVLCSYPWHSVQKNNGMAKEFSTAVAIRFESQRKANFVRLFVWCSAAAAAADWSNVRMNHHHFSFFSRSASRSVAPRCCCCFNHMRFKSANTKRDGGKCTFTNAFCLAVSLGRPMWTHYHTKHHLQHRQTHKTIRTPEKN